MPKMRADREEEHARDAGGLPPHQALLIAGFAGAVGAGAALAAQWFAPTRTPPPQGATGGGPTAEAFNHLEDRMNTFRTTIEDRLRSHGTELAALRTDVNANIRIAAEARTRARDLEERNGPTRTEYAELAARLEEVAARGGPTRDEYQELADRLGELTARNGPNRDEYTALSGTVRELAARHDLTHARYEGLAQKVEALDARRTQEDYDELTRQFGGLAMHDGPTRVEHQKLSDRLKRQEDDHNELSRTVQGLAFTPVATRAELDEQERNLEEFRTEQRLRWGQEEERRRASERDAPRAHSDPAGRGRRAAYDAPEPVE